MIVKWTALVFSILLSGCASIVSNSDTEVSVQTIPSQADFVISNKAGSVIASGKTPTIVSLENSDGYFSGERYLFSFSKPGYQSRSASLNSSVKGWYWGNIVFGTWVGFLVIDPLTGAMWKLPNAIIVNLPPELKSAGTQTGAIRVISLADVPMGIRDSLIKVN